MVDPQEVEEIVVREVSKFAGPNGSKPLRAQRLTELGVDSLRLLELTGDLARALGLAHLPIEAWIDQEAMREEQGFRLASLIELCLAAAAEQQE